MGNIRVVYKPDKSVAVIHPAPKSRRPDETEEQWLKRVFDKTMQPQYDKQGQQINPLYGLPYKDVEDTELPQTREDRNAWEWNKTKKKVVINQVKAKQLKDEKEKQNLIQGRMRKLAEDSLKKEGLI